MLEYSRPQSSTIPPQLWQDVNHIAAYGGLRTRLAVSTSWWLQCSSIHGGESMTRGMILKVSLPCQQVAPLHRENVLHYK